MKKKFSKLTSLLLVVCMLLSCFTVFAYADGETDDSTTEVDESLKIGTNRTFDEGWDYTNGIPGSLSTSIMKLDYERGYDLKYNYYFYVECHSIDNEYITYDATRGSSGDGCTFLEFDMKVSENCKINQFIQSAPSGYFLNLIGFNNGSLVLCGETVPQSKFKMRGDEWVSVSMRFNMSYSTEMEYDDSVKEGDIEMVATIIREGDAEPFVYRTVFNNPKIDENGFNAFRIGFASGTTDRIGQYYALDNFKYYSYDGKDSLDLDPAVYGYGETVNVDNPKNYPILGSEYVAVSRDDVYSKSLFMKVGLEYALYKEQRTALLANVDNGNGAERTALVVGNNIGAYGAPVKYSGDNEAYKGLIMIPLEAVLEYIGYPVYEHEDGASYDISTGTSATYITIGRDTATVGGQAVQLAAPPQIADNGTNQYPVIALDDVETLFPGFYVTYDNMGLICISFADEVFDRSVDLDWMIKVMKDFVFHYVTEEEIYDMVEENTNGFTHPYLYTTGERFDELYDLYTRGQGEGFLTLTDSEKELYTWLVKSVESADNIVTKFADFDENGNYRGFIDYRVYETKKGGGAATYIQAVNPNYELVYDSNGNPVYVQDNYNYELDENGDPIQQEDHQGNLVFTYNKKGEQVPLYKRILKKTADGFQSYIGKSPVEPYPQTSDGYDPEGGRFTVPSEYMDELALAYGISRNLDYVYLAYDWIIELGKLKHWGPGHFLNCADGSKPVAMAIDWMYNAFEDSEGNNLLTIPHRLYDWDTGEIKEINQERDVDRLIEVLYEKGAYLGVRCAQNLANYWPSQMQDPGMYNWGYRKHTNNWSAVCTSGMVLSALITMDYDRNGDGKNNGEEDYFTLKAAEYVKEGADKPNESCFLISDNLRLLATNGLVQYAPDGSYCESTSYWAYGTNALFDFIICLDSAAGSDFGFMRSWGIDKTCYFATHAEDSNRVMWGYHDGSDGVTYNKDGTTTANGLGTHFFTWVGQYLGDYDLCRIRKIQIDSGKPYGRYDILYYDWFLEGSVELPLSYHMEGIDGFAIRSGWEKNSMFVGMMGGKNTVPHGQNDGGAFVYHNEGIVWMCDLGPDAYNVKGYFGDYAYYRKNGEGNNTIILAERAKEVPLGQHKSAYLPLIESYTNEYGSYAIFNMQEAFAGYIIDSKRGVYVTNDYNTVVIQDETHTKNIEKMY